MSVIPVDFGKRPASARVAPAREATPIARTAELMEHYARLFAGMEENCRIAAMLLRAVEACDGPPSDTDPAA